MIRGVGIDLVEISRVERLIEKWGDRFLQKVFTDRERSYCEKNRCAASSFAARFAAKEALLKMLGTGLRQGIKWHDVEVYNNQLGKPEVTLKGRAHKIAAQKQIETIHISLSHEKKYAVAQVIGEGGTENGCSNTRTDAQT